MDLGSFLLSVAVFGSMIVVKKSTEIKHDVSHNNGSTTYPENISRIIRNNSLRYSTEVPEVTRGIEVILTPSPSERKQHLENSKLLLSFLDIIENTGRRAEKFLAETRELVNLVGKREAEIRSNEERIHKDRDTHVDEEIERSNDGTKGALETYRIDDNGHPVKGDVGIEVSSNPNIDLNLDPLLVLPDIWIFEGDNSSSPWKDGRSINSEINTLEKAEGSNKINNWQLFGLIGIEILKQTSYSVIFLVIVITSATLIGCTGFIYNEVYDPTCGSNYMCAYEPGQDRSPYAGDAGHPYFPEIVVPIHDVDAMDKLDPLPPYSEIEIPHIIYI